MTPGGLALLFLSALSASPERSAVDQVIAGSIEQRLFALDESADKMEPRGIDRWAVAGGWAFLQDPDEPRAERRIRLVLSPLPRPPASTSDVRRLARDADGAIGLHLLLDRDGNLLDGWLVNPANVAVFTQILVAAAEASFDVEDGFLKGRMRLHPDLPDRGIPGFELVDYRIDIEVDTKVLGMD